MGRLLTFAFTLLLGITSQATTAAAAEEEALLIRFHRDTRLEDVWDYKVGFAFGVYERDPYELAFNYTYPDRFVMWTASAPLLEAQNLVEGKLKKSFGDDLLYMDSPVAVIEPQYYALRDLKVTQEVFPNETRRKDARYYEVAYLVEVQAVVEFRAKVRQTSYPVLASEPMNLRLSGRGTLLVSQVPATLKGDRDIALYVLRHTTRNYEDWLTFESR